MTELLRFGIEFTYPCGLTVDIANERTFIHPRQRKVTKTVFMSLHKVLIPKCGTILTKNQLSIQTSYQ
jgi:hypothetical protein